LLKTKTSLKVYKSFRCQYESFFYISNLHLGLYTCLGKGHRDIERHKRWLQVQYKTVIIHKDWQHEIQDEP